MLQQMQHGNQIQNLKSEKEKNKGYNKKRFYSPVAEKAFVHIIDCLMLDFTGQQTLYHANGFIQCWVFWNKETLQVLPVMKESAN